MQRCRRECVAALRGGSGGEGPRTFVFSRKANERERPGSALECRGSRQFGRIVGKDSVTARTARRTRCASRVRARCRAGRPGSQSRFRPRTAGESTAGAPVTLNVRSGRTPSRNDGSTPGRRPAPWSACLCSSGRQECMVKDGGRDGRRRIIGRIAARTLSGRWVRRPSPCRRPTARTTRRGRRDCSMACRSRPWPA